MSGALTPTYTILIIDDEPYNLKIMFDHLESYGFRVLVAQNGESGLQRARAALPDLILLDVILSDMDGFTLCQQLKAETATSAIPVIFMTILSLPEDKVKAFTVGGADYVTKPVQWEEVYVRIATQLRLRDLIRQLQETQRRLEREVAARVREVAELQQLLAQQASENRS